MLKKLLREPLLHFLLIGATLFFVYSLQNDQLPNDDDNRIVISEAHIDRLIARWEKQRQRLPTQKELDGLVESLIREEVLYREALAMGLDKNDAGVRRRLAQKVEFIFADISDQMEPTESQLTEYLNTNRKRFEIPGRIDFLQVYFNTDKRGESAGNDADQLLGELTKTGSNVDIGLAGDGFMFGYQHEQLSKGQVARMFGESFANSLFELEVGDWQGPIRSSYGIHLVRIESRTAATQPELETIRDKVATEWSAERRRELNDAAYRKLRERYEVIVETGSDSEK